jgi:hypothetical protein
MAVLTRSGAMVNYKAEAELYAPKRTSSGTKGGIKYQRFKSAAAAIRFAIEELSPKLFPGTYLEIGDERFGSEGIRRLYESPDYPLRRRKKRIRSRARWQDP